MREHITYAAFRDAAAAAALQRDSAARVWRTVLAAVVIVLAAVAVARLAWTMRLERAVAATTTHESEWAAPLADYHAARAAGDLSTACVHAQRVLSSMVEHQRKRDAETWRPTVIADCREAGIIQ